MSRWTASPKPSRADSSMAGRLLAYGVTGFSGKLIAARAKQQGIPLVLAGRDARRVRAVADAMGFPWLAFGLDDPARLDESLRPFDIVLNIAGPFAQTARPLAESCLRTGTHYLDITGEPYVFQDLAGLDLRARERGVMLMPGAGCVIVASDCLAAHVAGRLKDARHLRLGFSHTDAISRGTLLTASGHLDGKTAVMREGRLVWIPAGGLEHWFDYGKGMRPSTAMTWADVVTAHHTTGIPNVEVYQEARLLVRNLFALSGYLGGALDSPPCRLLFKTQAKLWPEGPSKAHRDSSPRVIVAEIEDRWRRKAITRLRVPNGYDFTPTAALAIAGQILEGRFQAGFQTPAKVYGADFILPFEGVSREDFDGHGRPLPCPAR